VRFCRSPENHLIAAKPPNYSLDIIENKKFHTKTARRAKVFMVEMGTSTPWWRTLRSLREKKCIFDNINCLPDSPLQKKDRHVYFSLDHARFLRDSCLRL